MTKINCFWFPYKFYLFLRYIHLSVGLELHVPILKTSCSLAKTTFKKENNNKKPQKTKWKKTEKAHKQTNKTHPKKRQNPKNPPQNKQQNAPKTRPHYI